MRRFAIALASALSVAAAARAADRIAYVDVQRVISEVEEGKAAKTRLRSELEARRGELEKRQLELKSLKEEYDRQEAVLSPEAKTAKQQELQKKFNEAQQHAARVQEDLAGKEEETLRGISEKLMAVVREVSEKEGFNFVVKKEALLNAPPAADITNEVVRRYNALFSGGKGNAAATPAPKAKKQAKANKKGSGSDE